jgi:hypothetical protein
MLLLANCFTKLSSALTNKTDSKSELPNFSGDSGKFCGCYLAIIMTQLLLPT